MEQDKQKKNLWVLDNVSKEARTEARRLAKANNKKIGEFINDLLLKNIDIIYDNSIRVHTPIESLPSIGMQLERQKIMLDDVIVRLSGIGIELRMAKNRTLIQRLFG